jgi:hypothetical protein
MSDLTHGGGGCPVPLAAAAGVPGAKPSGGSVTSVPGTDLARSGGVEVTCELTTPVGGVPTVLTLTLVATRAAHAAPPVLLPVVQRDDHDSLTELESVLSSAQNTSSGQLVPVPNGDPVAFVIVDIGQASSAAFVLDGAPVNPAGNGPGPASVDAIATRLAARLG